MRPGDYDIPILLYHKVALTPPPGNAVWVSSHLFARQMAALSASGYVTVSFQDYLAYRAGAAEPPPRPLILTFDDGYESLYTIARLVLDHYGFKATACLVTGHIGSAERMDNRWDPPEAQHAVPMLRWPEVAAMAAGGHAFGSHTRHHPYLTAIGEDRAREEIEGSAADLRAYLGAAPQVFAYPFGDGAGIARLEALVQQAGYAVAVSTLPGVANTLTSPIWALPRLRVTEADTPGPGGSFLRRLGAQAPLLSASAPETDPWREIMLSNRCPHQAAGYQLAEAEGSQAGLRVSHPARRRALQLNPAAAVIWGLCDGQRTVAEMAGLLSEAYPGQAAAMDDDVLQALLALTEYGAIEWT